MSKIIINSRQEANLYNNIVYSPQVILLIGISVTVIGGIESLKMWPFSPFLWIHAILCIVIPFFLNANQEKVVDKEEKWSFKKGWIIGFSVCMAWIFVYLTSYYFLITSNQPLEGTNLWYTMRELFSLSVNKHGEYATIISSFLLLGVWAALGEEYFYRMFLFNGLRRKWPFLISAILSATLFGLRHALQLVYLMPEQSYPFVSGIAYFLWAGVFGFIFSWLLEKTDNFWVPASLHSLNIFWSPFVIYYLVY
jgi:membrane protease YdiL (CAAX protease family)